jgi:hypothetical protein
MESHKEQLQGPFNLIIHVHSVPPSINNLSESIIFAYISKVIISTQKLNGFSTMWNLELTHKIKLYPANSIVVNVTKQIP